MSALTNTPYAKQKQQERQAMNEHQFGLERYNVYTARQDKKKKGRSYHHHHRSRIHDSEPHGHDPHQRRHRVRKKDKPPSKYHQEITQDHHKIINHLQTALNYIQYNNDAKAYEYTKKAIKQAEKQGLAINQLMMLIQQNGKFENDLMMRYKHKEQSRAMINQKEHEMGWFLKLLRWVVGGKRGQYLFSDPLPLEYMEY